MIRQSILLFLSHEKQRQLTLLRRQDLLHLWVRNIDLTFALQQLVDVLTLCSPVIVAEDMIGVAMYELVRLIRHSLLKHVSWLTDLSLSLSLSFLSSLLRLLRLKSATIILWVKLFELLATKPPFRSTKKLV